MDFLFENCTFEENRSILPFQINLTIICQRKSCEEFRRTVLLCTSTDMETIWAWCVVLIHQYFWTWTVWKEKDKPSRFCVIKREYSNKLYELGCSPIKPTRITKTIIWPTSGPLVLKSRKKDYKECICL